MIINTTRFGDLEIQEEDVYQFISPILGFNESRRYLAPFSIEEKSDFQFLQSTEDKDLTFVIIDPFIFYPEYEVSLEGRWVEGLHVEKKEDIQIKVIVTARAGSEVTVNLKAPIVFNVQTREAAQIVLESPRYTTRHPLVTEQEEGDHANSIQE